MKYRDRITVMAAGIAALGWACAVSPPLPPQGTPAAPSAVYGSMIVPVEKNSDGTGVLRITNNTREAVQVFLTAPSGETFLRTVRAGNSEPVHVPGKAPGDTISLRAKTASGREYTSREPIALSASCARNYGAATPVPGCEWTLP
ncbi:MAG TPA: hypothetical protein VJ852_10510 [Gemmatimonadaceae bacterium]|nr:hypothetical protein [Gemmatimonadaceae bacterium]